MKPKEQGVVVVPARPPSPDRIRSVSVFFPAHNEEAAIAQTLEQAEKVLTRLGLDYEIIVVNDGSRDRTAEIVEGICRRHTRIRLVNHATNLGYGAAVWSGITSSAKDYIFFTDADLQFDLEELPRLLCHVPDYDVVIGYRIKRRDPFLRLVNAWGWNRLNRALFGLRVRDIDCAFKLFKRTVFDDMVVTSRGAMVSAEMLVRIFRQGFRVAEVGVTHYPRTTGSPTGAKPRVIARAFLELLRVSQGDLGNRTVTRLVRFGCVGAVNTLVDWTAYFTLTLLTLGRHYVAAKAIAYFAGMLTSYFLNRNWTFQSRGKTSVELPRFIVANLGSLVTNTLLMYLARTWLNLSTMEALVIATAGAFSVNFIACHVLVFPTLAGREKAHRRAIVR